MILLIVTVRALVASPAMVQLGENLGGVEFPWAISRLKENSQAPDKPVFHMINMVQITNRKDVIIMKKPTYYLLAK